MGGMSSARGTLLEYLVLALNAICGRYLREGELVSALYRSEIGKARVRAFAAKSEARAKGTA